jgi:hypothetical protein
MKKENITKNLIVSFQPMKSVYECMGANLNSKHVFSLPITLPTTERVARTHF